MVSEVVKVPEIKKGREPLFVDFFNYFSYDRAFFLLIAYRPKIPSTPAAAIRLHWERVETLDTSRPHF